MVLYILRGAFILLVASVSALYVLDHQQRTVETDFPRLILMVSIALGVSGFVLALDIFLKKKRLAALSGIFLGMIVGLVAAYALSFVVDLVGQVLKSSPSFPTTAMTLTLVESTDSTSTYAVTQRKNPHEALNNLLQGVKVLIGLMTCYVSISLVLQTKDDFRFSIPYVEFAKQVRGVKAVLLDSSVIIDGRIADVVDTQIIQGMLVVPKFILNELQLVADSGDKLRRARGRRGLETLKALQEKPNLEVSIDDTEIEGATVDQKLVSLAQQLQAQIMTNDFNLNKIATLRGVEVINLNDLAKSLRPVVLPGERLRIKVVKPGESQSQGVGYLDDGTMVVVENARKMLHQEIDVTVTSTLQTSAGRMIFGRFDSGDSDGPSNANKSDSRGPRPRNDSGDNAGDKGTSDDKSPPRNDSRRDESD